MFARQPTSLPPPPRQGPLRSFTHAQHSLAPPGTHRRRRPGAQAPATHEWPHNGSARRWPSSMRTAPPRARLRRRRRRLRFRAAPVRGPTGPPPPQTSAKIHPPRSKVTLPAHPLSLPLPSFFSPPPARLSPPFSTRSFRHAPFHVRIYHHPNGRGEKTTASVVKIKSFEKACRGPVTFPPSSRPPRLRRGFKLPHDVDMTSANSHPKGNHQRRGGGGTRATSVISLRTDTDETR